MNVFVVKDFFFCKVDKLRHQVTPGNSLNLQPHVTCECLNDIFQEPLNLTLNLQIISTPQNAGKAVNERRMLAIIVTVDIKYGSAKTKLVWRVETSESKV